MKCKFGMVLHAPPGDAPKVRDPFLIVDETMAVQAISRRAEVALGIDETKGVSALLGDFLRPACGVLDHLDLELLLKLTVLGDPPPKTLELHAADQPQRRFRARVTTCGSPPAALLVLGEAEVPAARRGTGPVPARVRNGKAARR